MIYNTLYDIRHTKHGLTLIELMITIMMLAILAAVIVYIFRGVLLSWSSQETRGRMEKGLDRTIEEVSRDVREAKVIQSSNDEIRFTITDAFDPDDSEGDNVDNHYIFYLYHASDPYPPTFTDPNLLYQLRKARLTGGIGGTLTDSGRIIITDALSPTHATSPSDLSFSSNIATIDLSITRRDETIRSRSQVKPRNT